MKLTLQAQIFKVYEYQPPSEEGTSQLLPTNANLFLCRHCGLLYAEVRL
jgi:hypothetical protein